MNYETMYFQRAFETNATRVELWRDIKGMSDIFIVRELGLLATNEHDVVVIKSESFDVAMTRYNDILFMLKDNGVIIEKYF